MKKCLPIQRGVSRDAYGDLARRQPSPTPQKYVPLPKGSSAAGGSMQPIYVDCRPRRSLPSGPMASAIRLYQQHEHLRDDQAYQLDDAPVHVRR